MASARSRQSVPSRAGDSVKSRLDGGDSDGETSSIDSDGNKWVPIWRTIQKKNSGQGDCKALEVVGQTHLHLHNHQHRFGLILN